MIKKHVLIFLLFFLIIISLSAVSAENDTLYNVSNDNLLESSYSTHYQNSNTNDESLNAESSNTGDNYDDAEYQTEDNNQSNLN